MFSRVFYLMLAVTSIIGAVSLCEYLKSLIRTDYAHDYDTEVLS